MEKAASRRSPRIARRVAPLRALLRRMGPLKPGIVLRIARTGAILLEIGTAKGPVRSAHDTMSGYRHGVCRGTVSPLAAWPGSGPITANRVFRAAVSVRSQPCRQWKGEEDDRIPCRKA